MNKKLYKQQGKFKVYIVNGEYIRKNINGEFTNFGQHYRFPFIPTNEFWIDEARDHSEFPYFIKHMMVEHEEMRNGKNYVDASLIAGKAELEMRDKPKQKDVRLSLLKTINGYKVYLVSGEDVRSKYHVDFTQGGNGQAYNFVPVDEIWIDDIIPVDVRDAVILHEIYESERMKKGNDYPHAHRSAIIMEVKYRKGTKAQRKKIFNKSVSRIK